MAINFKKMASDYFVNPYYSAYKWGADAVAGGTGKESESGYFGDGKEEKDKQARDAMYKDVLDKYGPDTMNNQRMADLAIGELDAQKLYGVNRDQLGQMSKGSLDTMSQRAKMGLSGAQRGEIRGLASGAARQTGAALGRQGVTGSANASAMRQLARDSAFQTAAISDQSKQAGEKNLEEAIGKRQLGTEASRFGQAALGANEKSTGGQLAIAGIPQLEAKKGILSEMFGGLTVICTELHRQGFISSDVYAGDCLAQEIIMSERPWVYEGYYFWAKHVASWMRRSTIVTKLCKPIALAWAQDMAFRLGKTSRGSKFGRFISVVGEPLCGLIGKGLRLWHSSGMKAAI